MKIKLELSEPLLISKGDEPDILLIQMNFCRLFKDTEGQPLPDTILKIEQLPPQIESDSTAALIDSLGESAVATIVAALAASVVLNMNNFGSLNLVWGLLNGQ